MIDFHVMLKTLKAVSYTILSFIVLLVFLPLAIIAYAFSLFVAIFYICYLVYLDVYKDTSSVDKFTKVV